MSGYRLPDFLIIGAPRCGTTLLAKNLSSHPDIFLACGDAGEAGGDVHFFDIDRDEGKKNFSLGLDWYGQQFAGAEGCQCVGEKTADYMLGKQTADLIADTLGMVKIIAVVRDPVLRARSHFWHSRHRLPVSCSLEEIVFSGRDISGVPVLGGGYYWALLKPFLECFGADNVMVVINEDLESSPESILAEVCRFLEVDDEVVMPFSRARINSGSSSSLSHWVARIGSRVRVKVPGLYHFLMNGPLRGWVVAIVLFLRGKSTSSEGGSGTYPPLPKEVVIRLQDLYRDDVEALSEFLDRDLTFQWWSL